MNHIMVGGGEATGRGVAGGSETARGGGGQIIRGRVTGGGELTGRGVATSGGVETSGDATIEDAFRNVHVSWVRDEGGRPSGLPFP
ncbi:hypothetical protein L1887_35012 [Cichorium endivia]|nr:hypothetical protein L1887_35012 [Cichorium endivia]